MSFQSDKFQIEWAKEEDSEQINKIFISGNFKGNISVRFLRNPFPIKSFEQDGDLAKIMVMRDNESKVIFAIGCCIIRQEYVNGVVRNIGYLTGLKILTEYQKKVYIISDAYRFLYENTKDLVDIYYTTIIKSNVAVQKMLEKKHKNMPKYTLLGDYKTYCFRAGKIFNNDHITREFLKTANLNNKGLIKGNVYGVDKLFEDHFSKYNFSPANRHIYGLKDEDFYSFRDEKGEILALAAVYNQQSYKQYEMLEYKGALRFVSKFPTKLFGYPSFPKPNSLINYGSMAFLYVRNNDVKLAKKFLKAVSNSLIEYDLIMVGLFESNPLSKVFDKYKTVKYESKLYTVSWERSYELEGEIGVEVSLL